MNHQEEIFIWNEISIRQRHDVFKIGTDALLLGAWVPKVIDHPLEILDAGTGTGILALMMAYYFDQASISGIDQEKAAVELSGYNFNQSLWSERLEVRQENILEQQLSLKNKYDLIICNPPFFYNQKEAKNDVKGKAKHAQASSAIWINALRRKLKPSGHLCIVIPYGLTQDWIASANEHGLFCQDRLDIYSFYTDPIPGRSLLHFHHELVRPRINQLVIYESYNRYSEAYLDLTKIINLNDHIPN